MGQEQFHMAWDEFFSENDYDSYIFKGSFMLERKQKRCRSQMASSRIQFNVHTEQRQGNKNRFRSV